MFIQKGFHLFPLFRLSWIPGEEVAPVEKTEEEEWRREADARDHINFFRSKFIILHP